jgi:hypothetical protein
VSKLAVFTAILFAFFFGGVIGWWVSALDTVGWNYIEETIEAQETHISSLHDFTIKRRKFQNDLIAFEKLNLIDENQYDGKYEPWMVTKLGLIKFDDTGFIENICGISSGLNNPNCPPEL